MKYILIFFLLSNICLAQKSNKNYALVINGGHDKYSNHLRYFNNIKHNVKAYRERGIPLSNIITLYADGDLKSTNHNFSNEDEKKLFLSEANLFSNEGFRIQGKASKENIKEYLKKLGKRIPKGGSLQLFITDHGSDTNSGSINLWGTTISADELGEMLDDSIPEHVTVNLNTNICYGGSLAKLTRKNICVVANQISSSPSYSEDLGLDRWGQNFAYALKNKIDIDGDKKHSFYDAYLYARELKNSNNHPYNSLHYILDNAVVEPGKVKDLLLEANSKKQIYCRENQSHKQIFSKIDMIEKINEMLDPNIHINNLLEALKRSGKDKLISKSLQFEIDKVKNSQRSMKRDLLIKEASAIKEKILLKKKKWDSLTDDEKKIEIYKMNNDIDRLRNASGEVASKIINKERNLKQVTKELELILAGKEEDVEKILNARKCLSYEI